VDAGTWHSPVRSGTDAPTRRANRRSAARHLVEITHQCPSRTRTPDDTTSIAVLKDSHKKAQDHLYVALKSAQHEAECKRVLDIDAHSVSCVQFLILFF
jgi:hypothetical protein